MKSEDTKQYGTLYRSRNEFNTPTNSIDDFKKCDYILMGKIDHLGNFNINRVNQGSMEITISNPTNIITSNYFAFRIIFNVDDVYEIYFAAEVLGHEFAYLTDTYTMKINVISQVFIEQPSKKEPTT